MATAPDVLVVCNDPNWLMRITEALGPIVSKKFQSTRSAFAELQPGRRAVVVAGPMAREELFSAPSAIRVDPNVALVAVVEHLDVDLLREAMLSGIDEVLEQGQLGELLHTVERLWTRVSRPRVSDTPSAGLRPGKVTLVTSTKGGQGSTTVAVSLARTLAQRGTTALVEGDPRYGDLIDALGYRAHRTELVRAQVAPEHWLDRFLYRHPSGVVVVLPRQDRGLDGLDVADIREALGLLQQRFEHTVIDAPLWSILNFHLNQVADAVLVVSSGRERDLARVPLAAADLALTRGETAVVISGVAEGNTVRARDIERITGLTPAGIIPWLDDGDVAFQRGEALIDIDQRAAEAVEAIADHLDGLVTPR